MIIALLLLPSGHLAAGDVVASLRSHEDAVVFYSYDELSQLARVQIGDRPQSLALSEDRRTLYVANYGTMDAVAGSISFIDLESYEETRRIDLADIGQPVSIAVSGARLFVASAWAVAELDPESGVIKRRYKLDRPARALFVPPGASRAYLANTEIVVLDLKSGRSRVVYEPPGEVNYPLTQVLLAPDGRQLWVFERQAIVVVDTSNDRVVRQSDPDPWKCAQANCSEPMWRFLTNEVLLLNWAGEIGLIDRKTGRLTRKVASKGWPLISSDGSRVRMLIGRSYSFTCELDPDTLEMGPESRLDNVAGASLVWIPWGNLVFPDVAPSPGQRSRVAEYARRFLEEGQEDAARQLLKYELEERPDDIEALMVLGRLELLSARTWPSAASLGKALRADPSASGRVAAVYLEAAQQVLRERRVPQYGLVALMLVEADKLAPAMSEALGVFALHAARLLLALGNDTPAISLSNTGAEIDSAISVDRDALLLSAARKYAGDHQDARAFRMIQALRNPELAEERARIVADMANRMSDSGAARAYRRHARRLLPDKVEDADLAWQLIVGTECDEAVGANEFLEKVLDAGPYSGRVRQRLERSCEAPVNPDGLPEVPFSTLEVLERLDPALLVEDCYDCHRVRMVQRVEVFVDACGRVRGGRRLNGSKDPLDDATLNAVRCWRFAVDPSAGRGAFRTTIELRAVYVPVVPTTKSGLLTAKGTRVSVMRTTPFWVDNDTTDARLIATTPNTVLPSPIETPEPVHPGDVCAERASYRLAVGSDGRVIHVDHEFSMFSAGSPQGYDALDVELEVLRQWRFEPARLAGSAVESVVSMTVERSCR